MNKKKKNRFVICVCYRRNCECIWNLCDGNFVFILFLFCISRCCLVQSHFIISSSGTNAHDHHWNWSGWKSIYGKSGDNAKYQLVSHDIILPLYAWAMNMCACAKRKLATEADFTIVLTSQRWLYCNFRTLRVRVQRKKMNENDTSFVNV